MSIKINGVRFSVVWIVIVFKKLKLTSQGKKNKLNVPVSQETSFSEWIAKLMHITRMSDNQFSILVYPKWERKPTLNLNYIANHFLPAEWHSAAVGGFHIGPQIQHWLINANLKCFGGGMGIQSWCIGGWGNSMVGDWLKGQQHICHQIKMHIHKHTKTSQLFSDSLFPWVPLYKENYLYSPSDGYIES